MSTTTVDALVTDFSKRLPKDGGFVTAKQAAFAISLWRRENPTVSMDRSRAEGQLLGPDGEFAGTWTLHRTPTGAGALTLRWWSPADTAAADAKAIRENALRDINDRISALLDAGEIDAAKALYAERRVIYANA